MRKLSWLAFSLALLFGITLQAADSPLSQISQDADVVVRIRAFDATVEKLAALVNAVQPGFGDMVTQNATTFGLALSNPALAGVDRTKDFYLVLTVRDAGEPKALFVIPTTDGPALQAGLPENFESQVRENWVFYATKEHGIPEAVSASNSLATLLSKSPAVKVFDDSDIGVHINVEHIAQVYDSKIQEGRKKFEEQLKQGVNTPGVENPEGALDMMKAQADIAFKILEETETLTVGLNVSATGLVIDDYIDLETGGEVAGFLKSQPKSAFKTFSKLGADLPLYIGMSGDFKKIAKLAQEATASLYKEEAVRKGMQDYITSLQNLKINSAVMAFDLSGSGNGLIRSSTFVETKSAAEMLASTRKMATALKSIKIGDVTQETKLQPEAETIGTRKIDMLTVKQQMDPSKPGAAQQAMLTGIVFGPNGIQSRVTALADGYLQVQGGGKESMEAALKSYDANSTSLSSARAGLADEAHMLVLFDLPGMVNNGLIAATTLKGLPFPLPIQKSAVEALQITRSYSATTAVGEDHAVRVHTQIPVEQFQGVMKLVGFFQSLRGR